MSRNKGIGGQKRSQWNFDSISTINIIGERRRLHAHPGSKGVLFTPVMGIGAESARRRNCYAGDLIVIDSETENAVVTLCHDIPNIMDYFPHETDLQIYQDGMFYYLDTPSETNRPNLGIVTVKHVSVFEEENVKKVSCDVNTSGCDIIEPFADVIKVWPAAEPGLVALVMIDGMVALDVNPTNAQIFSKFWAKGKGTGKFDLSLESLQHFNLEGGFRYKLIPDNKRKHIWYLVEFDVKSEVKFRGHREYYDFPVVTLSIVE